MKKAMRAVQFLTLGLLVAALVVSELANRTNRATIKDLSDTVDNYRKSNEALVDQVEKETVENPWGRNVIRLTWSVRPEKPASWSDYKYSSEYCGCQPFKRSTEYFTTPEKAQKRVDRLKKLGSLFNLEVLGDVDREIVK